MKMLNVKVDDWTHRNLKALAALKEMTVAATLKFLVGKEIEESPECELCRKYGHEPNETTIKAMKEKGGKSFKTVATLMKNLMSDE
jgi:hypothetical protein